MEDIDLRIEADAVVKEIISYVNSAEVSTQLVSSAYQVFINLQTKENEDMCISLTRRGYKVCDKWISLL